MTVSIIIPTRNRKNTLIETVTEFYKQTIYPQELIEFIAINDGEDDLSDVQNKFKQNNFRIIKNSGKGAAAARNTGILSAHNELIILLDDDILVTPYHVSQHVDGHKKFMKAIFHNFQEPSTKRNLSD